MSSSLGKQPELGKVGIAGSTRDDPKAANDALIKASGKDW